MSASFAFRARLLLGTLVACAGCVLCAQEASPRATPAKPESSDLVIRESVRRVALDVVVTDSNNKPVHGLSSDDFTIAEDGKAQRVISFDVHEMNPAHDAAAANAAAAPNAQRGGPLYVILYDMVNMQVDDQAGARKQLLKFLTEKPAGARFAIFVLSDSLRLVQGFTTDQRLLFAVMDPKSPKPHVPKIFLYGENYGRGQIHLIRWAFTQLAAFLDGLPGRKNVIWITGSVPTAILPTADANEAVSYGDEVKTAIDALARTQIAVYPLDVRGVVPTALSTGRKAGMGGTAMVSSSGNDALNDSYMTEGDIAGATGGHAFYSTNDLKGALAEATETGGNYYTISYSPSNKNYDGRMRKLHVELSKQGYHLAYRRSYFAYSPESARAGAKR